MLQVPKIVILAGPNGAGKSTSAKELLLGNLKVTEFVNADVIAQGISGFAQDEAAFKAGRVMLERIRELGGKGIDFAFEVTLSSRTFYKFVSDLKKTHQYEVILVYIWLNSPRLAVKRVMNRVQSGGHYVPEKDVLRRYDRSISNFFKIYKSITDKWYFIDNSDASGPKLIARGNGEETNWVNDKDLWINLEAKYGKR